MAIPVKNDTFREINIIIIIIILCKNTFAFDATRLIELLRYVRKVKVIILDTCRFHVTTFVRFSVFHKRIMRINENEMLSLLSKK